MFSTGPCNVCVCVCVCVSQWGCCYGQGAESGWRAWSLLIVGHGSLFVYSDKCCRAPACVHVCIYTCVFKRCETEWSHMTTGHSQSVVTRIRHLKHHGGVVPGCSIFQPYHHRSDLGSPQLWHFPLGFGWMGRSDRGWMLWGDRGVVSYLSLNASL